MQSAAKVLSKTAELSVGYGSKIDFGHRDRLWISADWGLLHLWKDLELEHSISNTTAPIGEVSFSQTGDRILASPHIFNLANYQWEALPAIKAPLSDQLETSPPGSFTIRNSAWDAAGNQLVVYSTYRSPRQERRRDAGWSGPTKRLLLLEGKLENCSKSSGRETELTILRL
ncbi:MAG: hypothetical protein HC886_07310 [Leptolyngbyaceae cyanobacterium SM1_1_3]|nr:hypothetical protein [Leptolyngbyaceae cyanobacterium SM1_1_3]